MSAVGQHLVRTKLPDGTIVRVQALGAAGVEQDVSGIGKVLDFQGVIGSVQSIAAAMTEAVAKAKPERASVEFGVDVGVETGGLTALLVKGTGTATLKVTLEWESSNRAATADG